ncbi:MAG: DNA ligase D [Rubrivivax sp.]
MPGTLDPLATYRSKRDFAKTGEPQDAPAPAADKRAAPAALAFVIQKHAASHLHYDFRLELEGVLLSWAVPKGPSLDPADKRMAIHVENHPLAYADFEGTIPKGQYGAGRVIVWDRGHWQPLNDPHQGLASGKLVFELRGHKLTGAWELVKIAKPGDRQEPWLLFKKRDGQARPRAEYDVISALPDSVVGKPLLEPVHPKPPGPAAAPRRRLALADAPKATLPPTLVPQLATLTDRVPSDGATWRCEIKYDGYRLLTRVDRGRAQLITRGGHDWTARMPALARAIERIGLQSAWLDGEIVVLDDRGLPDFNRLQTAFDRGQGRAADDPAEAIVYFVFDLPWLEGRDLRSWPLASRRALLAERLAGHEAGPVRFSADFDADPVAMLASVSRMGLEGLIAKRGDAPYTSGRSSSWLKLKCLQRQEFVVCGFIDRSDGSPEIGSLLLGVHAVDAEGAPKAQWQPVGGVGTGWDAAQAATLKRDLSKLQTDASPFGSAKPKAGRWSGRNPGTVRWVRPQMVVEVEFGGWTPDAQIRHAVWRGGRTDKPADEVVREQVHAMTATNAHKSERSATATATATAAAHTTPAAAASRQRGARVAGLVVTHADRVVDPESGLTKLDLVRYIEAVSDWLLPQLKDRPVSLVRAPSGVGGAQFFQKHDDALSIPGMREWNAALWPEHPPLLQLASTRALVGAAQMNAIEFHTWTSTATSIGKPDRLIFDLDPGEGTPWPHVQEAALLVRTMLIELGLRSWLKTSGGKGLHIVVPMRPLLDHDAVKAFSRAVVQHLARTVPSRFVDRSGPKNRIGKLFVDYLRNGFGATTVAAYSPRARPGLGVSMPVAWDELDSLKSGAHWTVATARDHLSLRGADPWADMARSRQTLAKAIERLGAATGHPSA